jgi:hypothetical protein
MGKSDYFGSTLTCGIYKVHQIRKLLPEKLIAPLKQVTGSQHANHAISPAALAGQLKKVTVEGTGQIQAFKKDWYSDEMRSLWEEANQAHYPRGDDCWRTDYEALARQTKSARSAQDKIQELGEQRQSVNEDPKEVIKSVKDKWPGLRIEVLDEALGLPVDVKVAGMSFRVNREQSDVSGVYSVTGKPSGQASGLIQEILNFLETRQQKQSLTYLLVSIHEFLRFCTITDCAKDLLASYSDVKTRSCAKCMKVFDNDLQLAIVKIPQSQDAENHMEWSSFHRKCA